MAVPVDLSERRALRPGTHEPGTDSRQARYGRRGARQRKSSRTRRPSTFWWSAAVRLARPRRSMPRARASRTGVVAERFGGQVLDTMAIENFISVSHTEGPKLAAALEQHVKDYDVDIMNLQTAVELIPAKAPGGLSQLRLASGAVAVRADRRPVHRRALAADERSRRGRVSQQGRRLLPALRRPLVQGQARRGDRRRQFRRRGGDRPCRHRRPCHPDRV